jgi:hypothetical protein
MDGKVDLSFCMCYLYIEFNPFFMNRLYTKVLFPFVLLCFASFQGSAQVTMPTGNTITNASACSGTFTDNGGTGAAYAANCNSQITLCPSSPGQYISVAFTAFNLQNNRDFLIVYDGNGSGAVAIAVLTGATAPGTFTASSANPSGCLTFVFISDATTQNAGWNANVSCSATPAAPRAPVINQDCVSKKKICKFQTFAENNTGTGKFDDFATEGADGTPTDYSGCLSGEYGIDGLAGGSSWYFFTAATSGTLAFTIKAAVTDDYDFALWGPDPTCPPTTLPRRCSFNADYGDTGLDPASTDTSDGDGTGTNGGSDKFVKDINLIAGKTYILLINRFSGIANRFDVSFSGTATLDCSNVYGEPTVPVEFLSFAARIVNQKAVISWTTASEDNSRMFYVEKLTGDRFVKIGAVPAAGNSTSKKQYSFTDPNPDPIAYYRITEEDYDGTLQSTNAIALRRPSPAISGIEAGMSGSTLRLGFTSSSTEPVDINVVNYLGSSVARFSGFTDNDSFSLNGDISSLPPGLYFVSISCGTEHQVIKLFKNQ